MLVMVRIGRDDVTLCGSHALMHRRSRAQAVSAEALPEVLGERRRRHDRRGDRDRRLGEIDALGQELTAAFAGERRGRGERRSA